jgi:hypothetical protein
MPSRREVMDFYIASLLTMQNAFWFASSVGGREENAQWQMRGIYAFA